MSKFAVPFNPRSVLSATVVLLILAMYAPEQADASCGDWLASHGLALDQPSDSNSKPDWQDGLSGSERRCRGPFCSDRDKSPENPAPSTSEVRIERWCLSAFEVTPCPSFFGQSISESFARPTAEFHSSVYRPPR